MPLPDGWPVTRDTLCPFCGHEFCRHDPGDGMCDAHTNEPDELGVCQCGRSIEWMQKKIAALSREALESG